MILLVVADSWHKHKKTGGLHLLEQWSDASTLKNVDMVQNSSMWNRSLAKDT